MSSTDSQAVLGWLVEWHEMPDGEERCLVTPVGDMIDHDIEDCACGPYIEHLGGRDWLYVHHSLDGREKYEGG